MVTVSVAMVTVSVVIVTVSVAIVTVSVAMVTVYVPFFRFYRSKLELHLTEQLFNGEQLTYMILTNVSAMNQACILTYN